MSRHSRKINISDVPQHKRVSCTSYAVDFFSAPVEGCTHHFLSHFHSDHYHGLRKSFEHPVFCSDTTAELVRLRIGARCIPMEMFRTYELEEDSYVQCIESHHCPGAVCFLFRIKDEFLLHTGDFRAVECFYRPEINLAYTKIYLDNTYDGFRRSMSQVEAIHTVIRDMEMRMGRSCLASVVYDWYFCTYLVGKEKLFLSVAEHFNMDVRVDEEKMKIYGCFSEYTRDLLNEEVVKMVGGHQGATKCSNNFGFVVTKRNRCLHPDGNKENEETTGWTVGRRPFDRICNRQTANCINIISPSHLLKSRLHGTFESSRADRIVVFFGTGWKSGNVFHNWTRGDGRTIRKGIEIAYVPYSEHSTSSELEIFRRRMRCDEFINTVNR